jgi:hypothetical protein
MGQTKFVLALYIYSTRKVNMKKLAFCVFIAVLFGSCGQNGQKQTVYETSTSQEKWQIIRDDFMVSDVPVSEERPLPSVLSEQEVLLKAADVAVKEGVLDPEYYAYQNNPALKDAKIETPILMTDADTGVPDKYFLNAVDANGISLASVSVRSAYDESEATFECGGRFISLAGSGPDIHVITKREAAELTQSQFPGSTVSEPMAIDNLRLNDKRYSHQAMFWYFTVSDTTRSGTGESGEYILDIDIVGYSSISGGISNRAALNRGGPHLNGYRMAKLDTPSTSLTNWKPPGPRAGLRLPPPLRL